MKRLWTPATRFAYGLMWVLRAAIAGLVLLGWRYLLAEDLFHIAVCAFLAILALAIQEAAQSYSLGWIVDANGQRQKVLRYDREGVTYRPTDRDKRLMIEAELAEERHRRLLIAAIAVAVLVPAGFHYRSADITASELSNLEHVAVGPGFLVVAVLFAIWALPSLGREVLYQLGYQDMEGAKVLDPPVVVPGLEQVFAQKAYGSARPMTEDEGDRALGADDNEPPFAA